MIELLDLPSVPLNRRSELPTVPSIYFVINSNGDVQYIGRSVNPRARWMSHHQQSNLVGIGDIKIAWIEISDHSLLPHIETALIHWFKPPLNGGYTGSRVGFGGMLSLRLRAGKRAEEIAVELNVAVSTVRNWDQLKTAPRMSPTGLKRLMKVYQCTFDELVQAEQEMMKP